jgi:hypothetical protein
MPGWGFAPGIPALTLIGRIRPASGPHTVPLVWESFQSIVSLDGFASESSSTTWMTLPDAQTRVGV